MTEIIPLVDRAILKVPALDERSPGGVILPQEFKDRKEMAQLEAEVIAVGEYFFQDCTVRPVVGDTVLIARYAGLLYTIDGVEHRLVNPREIIGIKK